MREYQVRICEGLGVKFPGPTRRQPVLSTCSVTSRGTTQGGTNMVVAQIRQLFGV